MMVDVAEDAHFLLFPTPLNNFLTANIRSSQCAVEKPVNILL